MAKVKELSGGLGQSGYVRIEQGKLAHSKYLPHICQILGLRLSDLDDSIDDSVDNDAEKLFSKIRLLPESQQIEIAQKVLANLVRP